MSAKYFCDVCDTELRSNEHKRLRRSAKIRETMNFVEIMHQLNGTWNVGNICHTCILDAVNKGLDIEEHDN